MQSNTFGKALAITTFGESHGPMIGVTIDGFPPGIDIDLEYIQREMDRRKPGQSKITTQRQEDDQVNLVSGVFEGKSTGHPITLLIKNKDQRSKDYSNIKDTYRPSHADFTYQQKYGIRDYKGGGRSSARETATRVAAGALAKTLLKRYEISISAFVSQVASVRLIAAEVDYDLIEDNLVRCPNKEVAQKMIDEITNARNEGDSLGGVVSCHIHGVPVGLGEPIFDRLEADLAKGMMSLPAAKGFEIGSGFGAAEMKGSSHNDSFETDGEGRVTTKTNYSGGVQGGISNGQPIQIKVAFKPVATIGKKQETVDREGHAVILEAKGRHDPCVVPRAVPIVEAMAALVVADHLLRNNALNDFRP